MAGERKKSPLVLNWVHCKNCKKNETTKKPTEKKSELFYSESNFARGQMRVREKIPRVMRINREFFLRVCKKKYSLMHTNQPTLFSAEFSLSLLLFPPFRSRPIPPSYTPSTPREDKRERWRGNYQNSSSILICRRKLGRKFPSEPKQQRVIRISTTQCTPFSRGCQRINHIDALHHCLKSCGNRRRQQTPISWRVLPEKCG